MKLKTGCMCQVRQFITLSVLIFEVVLVMGDTSCGIVTSLGGTIADVNVNGHVTKGYQPQTMELAGGTGSNLRSCWSNISDLHLRNLLVIAFKPEIDTCELTFCGTFDKTGGCYKLGNRQGDHNGEQYYKELEDFSVTSLMCGCSTNLQDKPECTEYQCNKNLTDKKFGSCGSVLFESNCTSCVFPPEELPENATYTSCHEASVKSIVVQPGYIVIRTHKKTGHKTEYPTSTSLNEELSTLYGPTGDSFKCQKAPILKPLDVKETQMSVGSIILIVLGVICFLTVLIGGVFTERHMRKRYFRTQFVQMIKDLKASEIGMNNKVEGKHLYDPKWELNRADLKINLADSSKVLGTGTFGKVIQGKLITKDASGSEKVVEVAVKTFHALDAVVNMNHIKALINEIRVMSFLGYHPNIVRFYGAHIDLRGGHIFCVMELCSKKSLLGHLISLRASLTSAPKPMLSPDNRALRITDTVQNGYHVVQQMNDASSNELDLNCYDKTNNIEETNQDDQVRSDTANIFRMMVQWSMDIANGMSFLQQNDILHIDLAARNILLTSDLTAKISDFGLSRRLYTSLDEKTGDDCTEKTYKKSSGLDLLPYKYIALESLLLGSYSSKSDVWSFGVTLWEIFSCGLEPYCHISEPRILQLFLQSGKRLSSPEYATNEIYCQMLSCWTDEPHLRPDFENLRSFFKSLLESLAA